MQTRLLTVYKLTPLIYLSLLLASCDPNNEDKEFIHNLKVKNESDSEITLSGYDHFDDATNQVFTQPILKKTIVIEANSSGPIVVNKNIFSNINNSTYFFGHHIDSLVLKFENGKGYYSTVSSVINTENWIANKSSLISVRSEDVTKEGDIYIYKITQEDYENAHVLP